MIALVIERTEAGFVVREPKGQVRAGPFHNRWRAEEWQARLETASAVKVRACLCCRASFESEGPHNRLCRTCRARSDDGHFGLSALTATRGRKLAR